MNAKPGKQRGSAKLAIGLVILLFFMWGLTMNLLNSLNEPFKTYMELSTTESTLLQVAYYGAYFVMAIPAAAVAKRWGYKAGIIMGLALFAAGCLITIPAVNALSYAIFLLAMFVVAAGATTLETNANPYITKLGDEKSESLRLNIAQSFNGVGSVAGPLIASALLPKAALEATSPEQMASIREAVFNNIGVVYIVLAVVLVLILVAFVGIRLPEPPADEEESAGSAKISRLLKFPHFSTGILAEFLFIGAQVGGMALIASYAVKHMGGISSAQGAIYLTVATALFAIGRIVTTPLMAKWEASKILGVYMIAAAVCFAVGVAGLGAFSTWAIVIAYFFISIGFPTIYSLSLRGFRGDAAKTGASLLTMSIVGAAIVPLIMGLMTDTWGIESAFGLGALIFVYCAWYAFKGSKLNRSDVPENNKVEA
ncbi:L-fucose permease [Actinobaculum suis]|uniref:MFS transporter n=1 Tax=Actinobaculum suis TaxID=1657 RepID=UPI00066FDD9E|nr:MFS transporter [Actinobaculum suis]KMY23794.1 L-fucose permease [Actinobaculum suis]